MPDATYNACTPSTDSLEDAVLEALNGEDPVDLDGLYDLIPDASDADIFAAVDGLEFDNYIVRRSSGIGWDVLKGLDANDLLDLMVGV